jgi:hypothetical protein
VFENRVLKRIFGSKRDEVTEEWRKLHNEELNDMYSSPSIFRVITSRRINGAGHRVWGREEACLGFWWGNRRERERERGGHFGEPGVDGRIILRWVFRKWDVVVGTGSSWLRIGAGGTCKCGNELSGSIKCGVLLD